MSSKVRCEDELVKYYSRCKSGALGYNISRDACMQLMKNSQLLLLGRQTEKEWDSKCAGQGLPDATCQNMLSEAKSAMKNC